MRHVSVEYFCLKKPDCKWYHILFSFKNSTSWSCLYTLLSNIFRYNTQYTDWSIRDRPFNLQGEEWLWFFVSFRNFFSENTRVRILIFSQNLTLGYMTKTLNQIIFFSSTKIRIFFSATLGIRIFFLEKTLQVKWSVPNYNYNFTCFFYNIFFLLKSYTVQLRLSTDIFWY